MSASRRSAVAVAACALVGAAIGLGHVRGAASAVAPPPAAHVQLRPEGVLSFDVRDAKTGEPVPCKLTLAGADGTPDPELTRNDIGRQEAEAIAASNRLTSI